MDTPKNWWVSPNTTTRLRLVVTRCVRNLGSFARRFTHYARAGRSGNLTMLIDDDLWEYEVDVRICGGAPLLEGAPPMLLRTLRDEMPPGWELVATSLRHEGRSPVLITTRR